MDLTLVYARGQDRPMPTPYTEFSPRAFRNYAALPTQIKVNRDLLEKTLRRV